MASWDSTHGQRGADQGQSGADGGGSRRKRKRTRLQAEADRALHEVLDREGDKVRAARKRRRWKQADLGRRCELAQSTISQIERGGSGSLSVNAWQRIALVLELPLDLRLGRDTQEEPADAGHLKLQELVLRLGREAGYGRTFELPTRSADPQRSTDVGLVDHTNRRLVLVECVNLFGDVGAAVRASDRKLREMEGLGIALGHGVVYATHRCFVVRATRRNRRLVARYPETFGSRFTGSSHGWVEALMQGREPPADLGLVWADVAATRVFAWRRDSTGRGTLQRP
jgi:transcriptional regulator with XRE-family HTH domain